MVKKEIKTQKKSCCGNVSVTEICYYVLPEKKDKEPSAIEIILSVIVAYAITYLVAGAFTLSGFIKPVGFLEIFGVAFLGASVIAIFRTLYRAR